MVAGFQIGDRVLPFTTGREVRRVGSHHLLVLLLRHFGDADVNRLREHDLVLRGFALNPLSPSLIA